MEMLSESDTPKAKSLICRIVAMLVKRTGNITTPDSYPPLKKSVTEKPRNALASP
jgi:hypothetical protein